MELSPSSKSSRESPPIAAAVFIHQSWEGFLRRKAGSAARKVQQEGHRGSGTRVLLFARARILRSGLASAAAQRQTSSMRALVAILVACALLFGVYHYYFKKMPVTDEGTAPTQAISLTGVRGDLLQIAQAERGYIAQNGHCAPLEELISSNSLAMSRLERDGYTYSVECSGGDFSITARHAPAAAGSPIRYPTLAIDQSIEVREVN
jgi:hypothetical protein